MTDNKNTELENEVEMDELETLSDVGSDDDALQQMLTNDKEAAREKKIHTITELRTDVIKASNSHHINVIDWFSASLFFVCTVYVLFALIWEGIRTSDGHCTIFKSKCWPDYEDYIHATCFSATLSVLIVMSIQLYRVVSRAQEMEKGQGTKITKSQILAYLWKSFCCIRRRPVERNSADGVYERPTNALSRSIEKLFDSFERSTRNGK